MSHKSEKGRGKREKKGVRLSHKKLEAWKTSMNLSVEIYNITQNFLKDELYGLINQIRRSVVSIPSNIAEGCARQTAKETTQFLYISLGSVAELETQLLIAKELNYIKDVNEILDKLALIRGLIFGLIKYYKSKIKN